MMGNAVGSSNAYFWDLYPYDGYVFGLWCADGYYWSSSVGLSSVDKILIAKFREFVLNEFSPDRLRLRVYYPQHKPKPNVSDYLSLSKKVVMYPLRKSQQPTLQFYINSRPLLRIFRESRKQISKIVDKDFLSAYFAGRFDGDGSVADDFRKDCRIAYGSKEEATDDQRLLCLIGIKNTKVYHYNKANEYCLYVSRYEAERFLETISPFMQVSKIRI
jgi:intein/homing endonuclease